MLEVKSPCTAQECFDALELGVECYLLECESDDEAQGLRELVYRCVTGQEYTDDITPPQEIDLGDCSLSPSNLDAYIEHLALAYPTIVQSGHDFASSVHVLALSGLSSEVIVKQAYKQISRMLDSIGKEDSDGDPD